MKKIISFSLWGCNEKYTVGALHNSDLLPDIYPDWVGRFHVSDSVPDDIIDKLSSYPHNEVVFIEEEGNWKNGLFWRFFAIDDPDVYVNLSRDTDSRLSIREKLCVDEFMASDKKFHNMIDHPYHNGIMGGMHGIKRGLISNMRELKSQWEKVDKWQTDQQFLNSVIYPIVKGNILLHDSINLDNFPCKLADYRFVGEVLDEHNNRDGAFEAYAEFLNNKSSL